jgi:ribose 5-phosphate isomerase B
MHFTMGRKVFTERKIIELARQSKTIDLPKDVILTALAKDKAKQLGVTLRTAEESYAGHHSADELKPGARTKVAVGSDHGGYAMKEQIKKILTEMNYEVVDVGTNSSESVDYPDFALAVARLVSGGDCFRGIMVDGAGIGSCMVANKVARVRAAMAYDVSSAVNSREHNNANVLTLGGKMIGEQVAEQIVRIWMTTEFRGGRHQARIDKISNIEKQNLK